MKNKKENLTELANIDETFVLTPECHFQDFDAGNLQKRLGLKQYSDPHYYGNTSILG